MKIGYILNPWVNNREKIDNFLVYYEEKKTSSVRATRKILCG